jgi:hypothetical protein
MNTRRISVKIVPQLLTHGQKQREFLAAKSMTVVSHPTRSSNLAPRDTADRFREWNRSYKGVASTTSLKSSKNRVLFLIHAIPLRQLQRCFQQWQRNTGLIFA